MRRHSRPRELRKWNNKSEDSGSKRLTRPKKGWKAKKFSKDKCNKSEKNKNRHMSSILDKKTKWRKL